MTGTASPTAAQMLRAVPSPPAKRVRSTPAASRSRAARCVSSAVVSDEVVAREDGFSPVLSSSEST